MARSRGEEEDEGRCSNSPSAGELGVGGAASAQLSGLPGILRAPPVLSVLSQIYHRPPEPSLRSALAPPSIPRRFHA